MAMFAPIPLPGIDNPQFKDVMDYWYQLKQAQTQRNQFGQNLEMEKQQFAQNYELKKQAENRANTLLPYMVQEYQDTHKRNLSEAEIKQVYSNLLKDALTNPATQSPSAPASINSGNVQQPNSMQMPSGMQGQAAAQPNAQSNIGEEFELRSGNPRLSKLDQVAGIVPGIPAPTIHYTPNGMVVTRYPSGRVTVQNANKVSGMKSPSVEDRKEASKLKTSGRDVINMANRALKIKKLIQDNPDMTGLVAGSLVATNLSQNKPLAEFDQTTRKLQADMAKYGSQRGGAQALKWAERSKPGVFRQEEYNLGMIQSILEDAKSDYDQMAEEYKERTGEEYPIKFPEMTASGSESTPEPPPSSEKKEKVIKWNLIDGKLVKG